ncbi:MAG: DsbA family protein [Alphaproteobacteria bacterium]|nr:DsbA family protein [Alphaproteobacteria bacterium]NCQ88352.1 DsbA family protein [Alphaproteobacteria bacterium]NCT05895.1 DsbA family protein [Alphaproteobacteria bacterium]
MTRFLTALIALTFVGTFATAPLKAQEFSDAQKTEIQKMFNEYLSQSGEAIINSVNTFQAKQMEEQQAAANEKAKGFIETIKKSDNNTIAGNPAGDVTIVEFFDYNCGYCRKALMEVEKLLEADKNVKFVFIDMPILGPQSMEASKWSLAAAKQNKYFDYHRAIMNHSGPKDESSLTKLAQDLGLDVEQLKSDKDSPEIDAMIQKNLEQATEIGIQGTPGFIIETEVARGYITADQMQEMIKKFR